KRAGELRSLLTGSVLPASLLAAASPIPMLRRNRRMKEVVFAFILALRLVIPTPAGRAALPVNPERQTNAGEARQAAGGPVTQARETAGTRPLVFTHVTVIDMTGAAAKPDQTVIIIGNRIAALGPGRAVKVPKDAQVVEAAGKFLIPGL